MRKLYFSLSVLAVLLVDLHSAYAVSKTWNKTTGGVWTLAANWTPTGAPAAGDDVTINSNQSANITAVPTISLLSLAITGNCDLEAGTAGNTLTVTGTFSVASGITMTIGGTTRMNFTLSTGANGNIAGTFTQNGGATTNTFTNSGDLTITGTGLINGAGAGSTFVISANATLRIGSTAGITTAGASGNIQTTVRTYSTGANYVYSGTASQVTGSGLTQNIPATLTINNSTGVTLSAATTTSGLLTMTSGTLNMANTNLTVGSLTGTSNLTHSSGTAGARTLTIGSDGSSPAGYSGVISNGTATSVAVTKTGAGILTLSGLNTYSGITTISAGTISINTLQSVNGGASSLGAPTTIANGTIVIGATGVLQYTGIGNASDRVITLSASGGTLDASGSGYTPLTLAGNVNGSGYNLVLTGTGYGYLSGIIQTGSGTVTKYGTGTWTLGGQNTYSGITYINVGIIKFGAHGNSTTSGPLGATAGGTVIASGGALDLAGYSEYSIETLSLNGSGGEGWGVLRNSGAADTYAGLITLTGSSYIDAYNGTIAITNTGTITGAGFGLTLGGTQGGTLASILGTGTGTLTKIEAGTWTLSGANTFSGITTVNAGTLMYGANSVLSSTSVMVSAGTLDLSTYTQSTRGGTLTVSNGAMYRIGGPNTLPVYSTGYAFDISSTVEYYGTTQTVGNQTYGNLTLSGTGTKTGAGSFTINGILNLSVGNPSATLGLLAMGANTLTMGGSATTIGPGDVTGIVTRTTLVAATSYTFGNQYTTINFQNIGTLPTAVSMNITIGGAPSWKTGAIKRYYDIIRTGGSGSFATLNLHYLDLELNSNAEDKLVNWGCESPFTPGTGIEYGRSNYDLTNNWVGTADVDVSLWHTTFGLRNLSLAATAILSSTWNGSSNTTWVKPSNWTPVGVPSDLADVTIPNATTTLNDPILGTRLLIGRLTLNSGAILNSAAGSIATISGGSGAWSNNGGTFNPNTSTIIFTNAGATISGITNFNNVTINSGALLTMASNGTMSIGGTMTNNGTWQAGQLTNNTVEYNGSGSQTVLEPNGTSPGYDNLILSGSGTKTANAGLSILENITLGSGTSFIAGSFTHTVKGNWTNSGGTFTPGSSTINFNGTSPQTITGTNTFNNLTASLTANVTLGSSLVTVSGALQINNTAKMTVPPTGQLTAGGTTTLSSANCLVLKSDATGTGSFIDNGISGTGTARVERYLTNGATNSEWHIISSPITNGTAGIFFNEYLMQYNESTHAFEYIVPVYIPLIPMKGYFVWVTSTITEAFSGPLNTGSQNISVTRTYDPAAPPPLFDGWNMVGNPYPSALNVSLASLTHVEASAWFWDHSSGNYKVWPSGGGGSHSQYAPPMQGFFVHCNDPGATPSVPGTGSIVFTNAARTHTISEPFYKSSDTIPNLLRMTVNGYANQFNDELAVYFNPERTVIYEPGFDAWKYSGIQEAPQIYTLVENQKVSVNALPFSQKNIAVPMGFTTSIPGSYTLIASNLGSFEDAISVSLEDLKLNTTQNLRTTPVYNFTYDTLDDANRFLLHFDNPTLGGKDLKNILPVQIYSSGSTLYIRSTDGTGLEGDVFIYDMIGRELYEEKLVSNGLNRITPVISAGYYVVKVVTNDAVYSGKIYLGN